MESLVISTLAIDGGKLGPTKSSIIEQDVFDQEELQALVEVSKQRNFAGAVSANRTGVRGVFLAGEHPPTAGEQDLDDIVAAVRKVVTAFLDKNAANKPINYATPEIQARL